MNLKGITYTILSALLFGITPLITTQIYALGANALTVVFFRSLFVLPILYLIMQNHHISLKISRHDLVNILFIAVFGSGLTTILLFSSYALIDVGTATTLHFLYPMCVSLLCFVVYKESLGKQKLIALLLAFLGTICFIQMNEIRQFMGVLLAACSAITYAFYMVRLEKSGLTHTNAYKVSFYIAFFITLETLLLQFINPEIHWQLPANAYLLIILLALVSSFFAVVLLQHGIRLLGSSDASLFCLFEPITSIITGYLFLNESLTPLNICGCLIILGSLIFMTLSEKKKQHRIAMKSDVHK